jgi:DNA-binding response OmpR family regulator
MSPQLLLVNPDRTLLPVLASYLEPVGFSVRFAADFDEAAALLKAFRFHTVVTAHRLGSHNGLHLVMRARAEQPELLAVVTSAVEDSVLESEARAFGAFCLVAPWQNPTDLLLLLRPAGSELA